MRFVFNFALILVVPLFVFVLGHQREWNERENKLDCDTCILFLNLFGALVNTNTSIEDTIKITFPICANLLKIEDDAVVIQLSPLSYSSPLRMFIQVQRNFERWKINSFQNHFFHFEPLKNRVCASDLQNP